MGKKHEEKRNEKNEEKCEDNSEETTEENYTNVDPKYVLKGPNEGFQPLTVIALSVYLGLFV